MRQIDASVSPLARRLVANVTNFAEARCRRLQEEEIERKNEPDEKLSGLAFKVV